jgi:hypothetical protein
MWTDYRILATTACTIILLSVISGFDSSPAPVDYPESLRHSIDITGDIDFTGQVSWSAQTDSLSASIRAVNNGEKDATLEIGPCSFRILGYAVKGDERTVVWHNELKENYICLDELFRITLNPGETVELENLGNVSGKIWALDLPDGISEFELLAYPDEGPPISTILNSENLK